MRCFPIFVDCRDLRIIRTHAFKMKLEHSDNKTDKLKRRCVSPRIALTSRITTQLFFSEVARSRTRQTRRKSKLRDSAKEIKEL